MDAAPAWWDREILARLYLVERRTAAGIAQLLGCSTTTVLRWLRRHEIPIRPTGPDVGRHGATCAQKRELVWSPRLACAVGLIATDGNLSANGKGLTFVSKDRDLVQTFVSCLDLRAPIRSYGNQTGRKYWRIQWRDCALHRWLVGIGLAPAKSRSLAQLAIPDDYFADFLRGCIDGDGSIVSYTDTYHARTDPRYVYRRLYVSLVSGSDAFLVWIRTTLQRLIGVRGSLRPVRPRPGRGPGALGCAVLRYAKRESLVLLNWIYHNDADLPCLARKRDKALTLLRTWPGSLAVRRNPVSLLTTAATGRGGETRETRRAQNALPARA